MSEQQARDGEPPTTVDPLHVPEEERTLFNAEAVAARLDRPMGALGVIFLFVVLGQTLASDSRVTTALTAVGWVLWVVFAGELALRAYIAKDQRRFWKRNWWQVVFLAVPFLRFVRALSVLRFARVARVARFGGVVSSAVRGSRSAGRLLSGRIGWLAVVTGVVILASSQLLYLVGVYEDYADALHGAAMATVTGTPLGLDSGFAQVVEVALGVYSVAVFATLAGALGAYFLHKPTESGTDAAAVPAGSPAAAVPAGADPAATAAPGDAVG